MWAPSGGLDNHNADNCTFKKWRVYILKTKAPETDQLIKKVFKSIDVTYNGVQKQFLLISLRIF